MTPHRASNGRGTLLLDRRIPAVGRIRRASGTTDGRTFRAINAMLDRLAQLGRLDTLRAIRTGELAPMAVYALYRTGELERLPDVKTVLPLEDAWDRWNATTPVAETRAGRRYAWKRLAAHLPGDAAIADLEDALLRVREAYAAHPVAFNRTRAAVLAFLRDRVTQRHTLYEACNAIPAYPEPRKTRPAPTIAKAILVRQALPAPAAAMWWSMYLGGMGPDEYDLPWEEREAQLLFIPGTKRTARERTLPRFGPLLRRPMGWKQFREALAALPDALSVQPYDARRGFFHLLEEAGVTRIRRKMYGGHEVGDVTGGYERAELAAFWVSDRQLVQERLALEEQRVDEERRTALKRA